MLTGWKNDNNNEKTKEKIDFVSVKLIKNVFFSLYLEL